MTESSGDKQAIPRRPGLFGRAYDLPYLLLTITMLSWSGNFIVGRAVRDAVPPVGLAFWRWVAGFLMVLAFAWPHLRRDWPTIRRHWRIILLLSVLGISVFNTLVYIGLGHTTAINALLVQSTMPVAILLVSFILYRERVGPLQGLGVAISFAGILIIIAHGDLSILAALHLNPGDLWVAAAVFSYAGYSVLLRRAPGMHPLSLLAVTFAVGAAVLAPFYIAESVTTAPVRPDLTSILAILYVGLFPSVIAYLCFNRGVALIGANRAGLFFYLMPVIGSAMAILFLGEAFRAYHAVGAALVLGGVALASRAGR